MLSRSLVLNQLLLVVIAIAFLGLLSQSNAACTYDFNRNGICETILHNSSISTPRTGSSAATKRQFTSGYKVCRPEQTSNCSFTASETMGSARSGSVNFSITAGAGQVAKIEATVGFRASGSYSYTIALGNNMSARPGTTWYFVINALGRRNTGNYRGEFFEQKGGWTSVGYQKYSSWNATNYNKTEDYWKQYR